MNRTIGLVSVVVAAQIAVIVFFAYVENERAQSRRTETSRSTVLPVRFDLPMPPITVRRRDGTEVDLTKVSRPTLVHFWATWCPPCREELPVFLQIPETHDVDVAAVALDDNWDAVDRFAAGIDRTKIFMGNAREIEHRLKVNRLPVTFLLGGDGRIDLRFDGVQDWTNAAVITFFLETNRTEPSSPEY